MDAFLGRMFYRDFEASPLVLVDVGAAGGVQPPWPRAQRYLQVIAFEADAREGFPSRPTSPAPTLRHLSTALSDRCGAADFHLLRKPQASSLLTPNRQFLDRFPEADRCDILQTIRLPTDTLDNQLSLHQIGDIDFIKLDTQGSELFILRGASRTLSGPLLGIAVEVEFAPVYQQQPLFSVVDPFIRKFGFQLFDLRLSYWKRAVGTRYGGAKGQVIFGDALYLRETDSLMNAVAASDHRKRRVKLLHALSIAVLYGYVDYALELCQSVGAAFDDDERRQIIALLKNKVPLSNRIPNFRGRQRIANFFSALATFWQPRGWATCQPHLGNRTNAD